MKNTILSFAMVASVAILAAPVQAEHHSGVQWDEHQVELAAPTAHLTQFASVDVLQAPQFASLDVDGVRTQLTAGCCDQGYEVLKSMVAPGCCDQGYTVAAASTTQRTMVVLGCALGLLMVSLYARSKLQHLR